MKPRTLTWVPTLTLLTVLAIPVRLAAQDNQEHNKKHKHHHYQVIDIGTFGGPQSFFNSLSLTDRFGFGTAFYGFPECATTKEASWALRIRLRWIPTLRFATPPTALSLMPSNGKKVSRLIWVCFLAAPAVRPSRSIRRD